MPAGGVEEKPEKCMVVLGRGWAVGQTKRCRAESGRDQCRCVVSPVPRWPAAPEPGRPASV